MLFLPYETQIKGGFGRKLDAVQVLKYKAEWEQRVRERKAKADEAMIARYLGAANSASLSTSAPERRDWIPNEERLTGFIKLLPVMKKDVYGRSYKKWDQGSTPSQVRGCRDCIDVFQQILVTLCGWYPPNHFGETGIEDFIDSYVAFSYRWHRGLEEPLGYGTGGTIVRVLVSDAVMHDIDDLIVSMVRSLLGNVDSDVDFLEWQASWKSAEDRPEERSELEQVMTTDYCHFDRSLGMILAFYFAWSVSDIQKGFIFLLASRATTSTASW